MNEAAKKFRKRLAIVGSAAFLATGGTIAYNAIQHDRSNDYNKEFDVSSYNKDLQYFDKGDLYSAYCYISEQLEDSDNLDNEKILEISNMYKKLRASISYIDAKNTTETEVYSVLDELPNMDGLYDSMSEKLVDLVSKKSLLLIPSNLEQHQKLSIIEQYITNTGETPLEEINIAQINGENKYYVSSDDNELLFKMTLSKDGDDSSVLFSFDDNLQNVSIKELSKKSISVTENDKTIPNLNTKELVEDNER